MRLPELTCVDFQQGRGLALLPHVTKPGISSHSPGAHRVWKQVEVTVLSVGLSLTDVGSNLSSAAW